MPTGTVAFLFTDVEGSTRLWETQAGAMDTALEQHDATLRAAIAAHDGHVFSTAGDSFTAAFHRVGDAVDAALAAQAALPVGDNGPLDIRVRMGIHAGEAHERGGDYFGPVLNRAARVMGAAHGGQVVITATAAALLEPRHDLLDLGDHRLADVAEPLRLMQVGGDRADFGPLRSLNQVDTSLPVQRTRLVGRSTEIERVRSLLTDSRLVTLTGVGGTGKTRLALEVATQEVTHRSGGAFFVDLSPVVEPTDVVAAFVDGVGLAGDASEDGVETLRRFLGPRNTIVLVDNCEHLLDAVAELVDALLEACPQLHVIATSREALSLDGERTLRVPSLALSDESGPGPAVRLFVERAVSADDGLIIDDALLRSASEICERLDGIPLAIELAAARTRSMGIDELASRLDDRFALLTGGRRGAQQRQRTLQAALDWSHDLLTDEEQRVLRRLSVFAGGWTLESVAPVADIDPIVAADAIDSLVGKSLVTTTRQRGTVRYSMLETVRHYAEDRLVAAGEVADAHDRHYRHFVDLLRAVPFVMGDFQGGAYRVLSPEAANLDAATARAKEKDDDAAVVLLRALGAPAIQGRMRTSLEPALDDVRDRIERAGLPTGDVGPVMLGTAAMNLALGRYGASWRALDAAIAAVGDPPEQWALTAHALRLLPVIVTTPEQGLVELARLRTNMAPFMPSPQAGHLLLAEHEAGALNRLRRYDETVELAVTALEEARVADLLHDGHTTQSLRASGIIAAHLARTPDRAASLVAMSSDVGDFTWWYPYLARIADGLHLATTSGIDAACTVLAAAARSDERTRLPIGDSAYLTAFARLAHLDGDDDRAAHYLASTGSYLVQTTVLAAETLAAVEGWTDDQFAERSQTDQQIRQSRERWSIARDVVPDLLRAEVARWAD